MSRSSFPLPSSVFAGRDAELARLHAALARIAVVLVVGVAGIGKSALAQHGATRWQGLVATRQAKAEPLRFAVDDLRRELAKGRVADLATDDERLLDLAAHMDELNALVVLDDLHLLDIRDQASLLGGLAATLRRGRFVATSRTRVARTASDPDWQELHLAALDDRDARALWQRLDELYGVVGDFGALPPRLRQSPFLLRRAHGGALADEDPIEQAVRTMSEAERKLALLLALADRRLLVSTLADDVEGDVRSAIRRLVTLLVANVDAAGSAGIESAFRDSIVTLATATELRDAHERLAGLARTADLDRVLAMRTEVRHLAAAGLHEHAGKAVIEHAAELIRLGATPDLIRSIETIPEAARTHEVKLARARAFVRLEDPRRGHEELARLAESCAVVPHDTRFSLATTTAMVGRVSEGVAALESLLADPTLVDPLRKQVVIQYTWGQTMAGRGAQARVTLRELEEQSSGDEDRALYAFYRGVSAWSDEAYDEMAETIGFARTLVPERAPPYATGNLVPLSLAAVLARLGRFEEAFDLLEIAERGWARADDLSSQLFAKRMRAMVHFERGERIAALGLMESVAAAYQRAGSLSALGARAWVGRFLLIMGRRREALALLDAVAHSAQLAGALQTVALVERARNHDPIRMVVPERPSPSEKRGEHVRSRVVGALTRALAGEPAVALALLEGCDLAGTGYGVDRAFGHLTRAICARLDGRMEIANREIAAARKAATADGGDDDLVPSLESAVATQVVVVGRTRKQAPAPSATEAARHAVVLDGRTHRLRAGRREVDFVRRPVVRQLLYALARRPGEPVSKEVLAATLWPSHYNPTTHDNAIWVNVRRLRMLLGKTGLAVEHDERGYRLEAPEGFLFVDAT